MFAARMRASSSTAPLRCRAAPDEALLRAARALVPPLGAEGQYKARPAGAARCVRRVGTRPEKCPTRLIGPPATRHAAARASAHVGAQKRTFPPAKSAPADLDLLSTSWQSLAPI